MIASASWRRSRARFANIDAAEAAAKRALNADDIRYAIRRLNAVVRLLPAALALMFGAGVLIGFFIGAIACR